MLNFFALIILSFCASVFAAPPVLNTRQDLTDFTLASSCGQEGVFLSGTVHSIRKESCRTKTDESLVCSVSLHFNLSDAKVQLADGNVVRILNNENLSFKNTFDTNGVTSVNNIRQRFRVIDAGQGLVGSVSIHSKCSYVNGVGDCQIFKVEFNC